MQDANAAGPTAQDVTNLGLDHLDHLGGIRRGEHLSVSVHLYELVSYLTDGTPSYRRVRVSDAMAHPGQLQALVRNTARDLDAEMDAARTDDSSSTIERRAG